MGYQSCGCSGSGSRQRRVLAKTSGPIVTPSLIDTGIAPNRLFVNLSNPTNRQRTVYVTVKQSTAPTVSGTPVPETTVYTQSHTLPPGHDTVVSISAQTLSIYRVVVSGEIQSGNNSGIEASVVAGQIPPPPGVRFEASTWVPWGDFVHL